MAIAVLPNPNMDFTPFDILPASDLDKMVANIEALANANIGTSAIESEAVTASKIKMSELLDVFYPVGSYYETSNSQFDPNTAWGGTWVEDTAGRVTVAQNSGTFSTVGGTGGEEKHALGQLEVPGFLWHTDSNTRDTLNTNISAGSTYGMKSAPNSKTGDAHNNLQPYIVVKRWHRTA